VEESQGNAGSQALRDRPIPLGAALLTLLLCAFWGGISPTIKIAVTAVPPLAVAFWRFLIGLVCVWIWCRSNGIPYLVPRASLLPVIGFSMIFTAQIAFINIGTQMTLASYSAVLLNTSPLFVAVMAHWILPNDRLSSRRVIGLVLAFSGVAVLFLGRSGSTGSLPGNALCLLSGFLLGSLQITGKRLLRDLSPFQVVFWEFAFALPVFGILSLLLEPDAGPITLAVAGSIVYQGLVVAGICFVAWLVLLRRYSATGLSSFQFSIPVFGVLLSRFLLGEPWSAQLLVALPLVAVGILLVTRCRVDSARPAPRPAGEKRGQSRR
jgi:drug/metabolite transporter (DMT)-like permease